MASKLAFSIAVLTCLAPFLNVNALWRLQCDGVAALAPMDPITSPGETSSHVHTVKGSSEFSVSATAETLLASNCTSCQVKQDKSAYWTPKLYFIDSSGTTTAVPEVQGHLTYYKYTPCYINGKLTFPSAMPNDLRMISGDTFQRNFTWPNPDPPMPWTGPDASQAALAQKAIGFNCLNYKMAPEPSLYRHFLPTKAYIDANCLDGLRLELLFPQCWNGSLDSTDHKSHLAFPSANLGGGSCPQGYDQLINQIFYETIYDTTRFAQQSGQFALANGDPTGYGYHGDIIVAWDEGVLANATAVCGPDTDPTDIGYSGITESCPVFDINLTSEMDSCKAALPVDLSSLNVTGPMPALPLNNRVQFGPAYATRPSATTSSEPSSTTPLPVASSAGPTLSYSSASSEASSPQADLMVLSTPSTISSTSASTVSTSVSPLGPALNAVATSFTTIGDVVHENIVVEVTELVTICVTDTVFATPTVVAKRNQHMHHHKHYNRHAW